MRSLVLVLASVLAAVAGCSKEPEPAPQALSETMHRQAAGKAGPDGWFRATSTTGGFSVSFPGPFDDFDMKADGADGRPVHLYGVGMVTAEGVKLSATALRRLDGSPADVAAIASILEELRNSGALKSQEPVTIAGRKGTDVTVVDGDRRTRMRAVAIGPALYQLSIESPAGAAVDAAREQKFLDSFEPAK